MDVRVGVGSGGRRGVCCVCGTTVRTCQPVCACQLEAQRGRVPVRGGRRVKSSSKSRRTSQRDGTSARNRRHPFTITCRADARARRSTASSTLSSSAPHRARARTRPASAAMASPALTFEEAIGTLHAMFERFDVAILEAVLELNRAWLAATQRAAGGAAPRARLRGRPCVRPTSGARSRRTLRPRVVPSLRLPPPRRRRHGADHRAAAGDGFRQPAEVSGREGLATRPTHAYRRRGAHAYVRSAPSRSERPDRAPTARA
jgi:hypothetical protein